MDREALDRLGSAARSRAHRQSPRPLAFVFLAALAAGAAAACSADSEGPDGGQAGASTTRSDTATGAGGTKSLGSTSVADGAATGTGGASGSGGRGGSSGGAGTASATGGAGGLDGGHSSSATGGAGSAGRGTATNSGGDAGVGDGGGGGAGASGGAGRGGADGGAGRGGTGAAGSTTPAPCTGSTACIDFANEQQEIDGLGAAVTGTDVLSTALLDATFKNDTHQQMGLSILRVEISPYSQSDWDAPKTNAANAKARGAKYVLATPWSPPASMKTNNNVVGGELATSSYAAYAAYLKSFYEYTGVDIISVQNEPNISVTYASASWSATQLYNFAKNNAQDIGAPVLLPETFNYDTSFSDPILNDSVAASHVAYIGLHLYGAQLKPYTLAVQKQKKVWMTEHYFDGEDIGSLLSMAKEIMDCFNDQMNAYVWWYLQVPNCNLVTSTGTLQNKGYVMGQFSKYIRPGAHQVSATYQPQSDVNVEAFDGDQAVIVALNRNTASKSQTFALSNTDVTSLRQITTSSSKKLADDGVVTVTNGSFTATLAAQSVTTFVSASP